MPSQPPMMPTNPTPGEPAHPDGASAYSHPGQRIVLAGVAASPGLAVGRAFVLAPEGAATQEAPAAPEAPSDTDTDTEAEHQRLAAALARAIEDTYALAARVSAEVGEAEGQIFEAQALMLEDPTIRERADELIDTSQTDARSALTQAAEEQAQLLANLADPLLRARAADVRDAAGRVAALLSPERGAVEADLSQRLAALGEPAILLAKDLAPSETVRLPLDRILGIATALGGTTSHAAILARARDMPATLGLGDEMLLRVRSGDTIILDGTRGHIVLWPDPDEVTQARRASEQQRAARAARRARGAQSTTAPGQTRDGQHVAVLANVGSLADAQASAEVGADGVGLLRSEFLFASRDTLPSADEQADMYTAIIQAAGGEGHLVIIRTLDAGSDKPLPALTPFTRGLPAEANPALGIRGIRLHHELPELLVAQFQGIRAAAARTRADLRVMLPMVTTADELAEAKAALQRATARPAAGGQRALDTLPLGIMVETPASVLRADLFAREAEFFSIGTNDLTQYIMAADRLNPRLASLADPLQPAVLHAIARISRIASKNGRPVGVCGEMAGDPTLALLLVGLGVSELSMAPYSIPAVKEALAARTLDELRALARRVLRAETAMQARASLESWS